LNDTYFLPDPNSPSLQPPCSLICFINDSLITWDIKNGMKYRGENTDLEGILKEVMTE
jgi:hypothetical protein